MAFSIWVTLFSMHQDVLTNIISSMSKAIAETVYVISFFSNDVRMYADTNDERNYLY